MTKAEALRIVKLLCSPYNVTVNEELLEVWFNAALEKCDYETGLRVARSLVSTEKFFPKPAQFNEIVRPLSLPSRQPLAIEAGEPEINPDVAKQHLAEMRAKLK